MLAQMNELGYAHNVGEWETQTHIAAIAAPIRSGGQVLACMNIVMLKNSVSLTAAVERYLGHLQLAISKIERLIQTAS